MSKELRKLWECVHTKKLHLPHFLREARLSGLRGVDELEVGCEYPVSVIAGG